MSIDVNRIIGIIFDNIKPVFGELKKLRFPSVFTLTFSVLLISNLKFHYCNLNSKFFIAFAFSSSLLLINFLIYLKPVYKKIPTWIQYKVIVYRIKKLKNEEKWILALKYLIKYRSLYENSTSLCDCLTFNYEAVPHLVSMYKKGIFLEKHSGLHYLSPIREDVREYLLVTNGKDLECKNIDEQIQMDKFISRVSNIDKLTKQIQELTNTYLSH